jgi:hypothetical protein
MKLLFNLNQLNKLNQLNELRVFATVTDCGYNRIQDFGLRVGEPHGATAV